LSYLAEPPNLVHQRIKVVNAPFSFALLLVTDEGQLE
jgi:hypothetical protein